MYKNFMPEASRVRVEEYRAGAGRFLKRRDLSRPTLRGRAARKLFDAAFALEAEESWRAVWDRMAGKRRCAR